MLKSGPSQQIGSQAKNSRIPVLMNKEFLAKHKHKKEVHRVWKQGAVTWEEYRNIVWDSRDELGKLKPEWNSLYSSVKNNKRGFCRCTCDKRRIRENMDPLLHEMRNLVTENMKKACVNAGAYPAGKQYLGVLLNTKLNRSQKCSLAVESLLFQTAAGVLPTDQEERSCLSTQHLWGPTWHTVSNSGLHQ